MPQIDCTRIAESLQRALTFSLPVPAWLFVLGLLASPVLLPAQSIISGRVRVERFPGANDSMPLSGVLCFAGLAGPGHEPWSFRTWETEPAGWYRISGGAGNYTLVFTQPAAFFRPVVLNNVFLQPGDFVDRYAISPRFDYGDFYEKEWDRTAGHRYFQSFVASGRSVTQVGFRLAHDGVDGFGPRGQNLVVSVHRRSEGPPDHWPQVGPEGVVFNVDSGGGKNYLWSAGWNSGEVPLKPGETYAVQIRAEEANGVFQPFWRNVPNTTTACYRSGTNGAGWEKRHLWMAVATDGDGLLVPFNKRVQKEFGKFAGMSSKWSQTYVAQGRGLAAVLLYAAVSGAQPPLSRQRTAVRIRHGGHDGPVVGVEKIAIGNGNYTGDASWGRFGAVFAPGEVPLTPGATYAIEWESLENHETLDGFINIKGQVSDGRAAFNPYRKQPRDDYALGSALKGGINTTDFDLDAQVIEYEFASTANWDHRLTSTNLLRDGGFDLADSSAEKTAGDGRDAWKSIVIKPGTTNAFVVDRIDRTNRFARIAGRENGGTVLDGSLVQRVDGLSPLETYRVSGRLRSTWATDAEHQCWIGCDPTGQDTNASAATIRWTTLPGLHGNWISSTSEPIRPSTNANANAMSVWLRARSTHKGDKFAPFRADFDDIALQRVVTGLPGAGTIP